MISLGVFDNHLTDADIERYVASVASVDRQVAGKKLIGNKGVKPLRPITASQIASASAASFLLRLT